MERKIVNKLQKWKESKNRKPLIIFGARQVGKTYTSLLFGKKYYKNTVYFNLESSLDVAQIFQRDLDTDRIIMELSIKAGESIFKGETLIILDEIQSCERALTSLKYFNENNNDYHIIAAGSLLGVAVNREKYSFPVGKIDTMTLFPLDFEEFLWALDKKEFCESIKKYYELNTEFPFHEEGMDLYKKYIIIGGMPRAVLDYKDTEDFNFVTAAQKNINDSYISDMAKYATPFETVRIMGVYNSIPAQLAKENKKFQYKVIKSGARANEYEVAMEWLKSSGIINKCVKIKEGKIPLMAYADNSSFKIYMNDIGLLCSFSGINWRTVMNGDSSFNNFKGAMTENYVCGELFKKQISTFYWESEGKAEIDFIIQDKNGDIIPIEVKSSENVRSKSLSIYQKKYTPKYSIRISGKNFGYEENIKSVPLYAIFCIE